MNRLSVRSRLTLVVSVLAAGLGLAAATLGVSRVESSLIDEAVTVAGDEQISFVDDVFMFFDEYDEADFFDDELLYDEEYFNDDDEFYIELASMNLVEIDVAGALDGLLEAADIDRDGELYVLTDSARIAVIDLGDGRAELLPEGDFEVDGAHVVSQLTIDELYYHVVEPDFDGIFLEELFGSSSSPDELPDLRYSLRESNGIDFIVVADVSDMIRSVDRIRTVAWVAIPVVVLLGAAATWLLTGRALRPVHDITSRVGAISGGTLHERVPEPESADEIADLARTMNQMLDRLESDDQRLRQFVSDASHELRSPVAVLRSEAEVALLEPQDTTVEELADGMLGESIRLQRVVDDLLVLARGEEHRAVGGFGPIDLDDVVLTEAARRRRLAVDVRSVSAGRVWGSQEGCARIITHLLDNAARHGTSHVWVGLRSENETVTMWVDDDGPGIPVADRQRVFERFARLDEARTRDGGGAGLGLAVVAETVAAMGGQVEISNASSGGARFVLHWPAVTD